MRVSNDTHSSLEYAVLGLIQRGVRYGYEIYKEISAKSELGQIWITKPGNLYALLGKMVSVGWLTLSIATQGNRPPRKEYALTPIGEKAFRDWCLSPVKHPRGMRQDFLVRWFFIRSDSKAASDLLKDQLAECSEWEKGLIFKKNATEDTEWFESTIYQFRINQIQGIKSWLKTLQRREE